MSHDMYELIAQALRYVFVALMLLIVLRAVRGLLVDSRRSTQLRHMLPLTGQCGELLVRAGGDRVQPGMRYPIIREGTIGTWRRSDVRIRHRSIRRRHAYFQLTENGLIVRTHAGSRMLNKNGRPVRELLLGDNDSFCLGDIQLMLVLNMPDERVMSTTGQGRRESRHMPERAREETLFEPEVLRRPVRSPERTSPEREELFDREERYMPPETDDWVSELHRERMRGTKHRQEKRKRRDVGWGEPRRDSRRTGGRAVRPQTPDLFDDFDDFG